MVISRSIMLTMKHTRKIEYKIKVYILCSTMFSPFVPLIKERKKKCYRQTGHMCQNNTV